MSFITRTDIDPKLYFDDKGRMNIFLAFNGNGMRSRIERFKVKPSTIEYIHYLEMRDIYPIKDNGETEYWHKNLVYSFAEEMSPAFKYHIHDIFDRYVHGDPTLHGEIDKNKIKWENYELKWKLRTKDTRFEEVSRKLEQSEKIAIEKSDRFYNYREEVDNRIEQLTNEKETQAKLIEELQEEIRTMKMEGLSTIRKEDVVNHLENEIKSRDDIIHSLNYRLSPNSSWNINTFISKQTKFGDKRHVCTTCLKAIENPQTHKNCLRTTKDPEVYNILKSEFPIKFDGYLGDNEYWYNTLFKSS